MRQLVAVTAAFIQQWKELTNSLTNIFYLVGAIPTAIVIGWVAHHSGNAEVITYLLVGAPFINIWNNTIFRVGWSLNDEVYQHVLDFSIISRTPLILVLLGKSLAQLAYQIPAGIIALFTMFIMVRQAPVITDIPALLISLLFIFIGLIVCSLFMSPLMVLVGGRAGFFNAFMGLGVMISGFMFPITRLPGWLEVVARIIPTSWAMDGVLKSITGYSSYWSLVGDWGACILTSAFILSITYLMFHVVEKRIRTTGELSAY